jgi:hypothetical protein
MRESQRYTWLGPAEVEHRIDRDQLRVRSAVEGLVEPPMLRALILAGGYGRGEGGYRWADGQPLPFNDYDYFIVVSRVGRRALRRLRERLAVLGHQLSAELGLEVDFAVLAEERLPHLPHCLMYSELKWRHRTLVGDSSCLQAIRSPAPDKLPLAESTRTMLNRGALLLMNEYSLRNKESLTASGEEQFERYLAKAILASGEALLASKGNYHPALQIRQLRLSTQLGESGRGFLDLHGQAVEFKYGARSTVGGGPDRKARQREAVAAWRHGLSVLESSRLSARLGDWPDYAAAGIDKGQSLRGRAAPLKHILLHAVDGRRMAWLRDPSRLTRHPRERLIAALPLLLQTPGCEVPAKVKAALGVAVSADWVQTTETFLRAWRRYC